MALTSVPTMSTFEESLGCNNLLTIGLNTEQSFSFGAFTGRVNKRAAGRFSNEGGSGYSFGSEK